MLSWIAKFDFSGLAPEAGVYFNYFEAREYVLIQPHIIGTTPGCGDSTLIIIICQDKTQIKLIYVFQVFF